MQNNVSVVGLSALMTTTVGAMEETIKALRAAGDFKKLSLAVRCLRRIMPTASERIVMRPNAVSAVNYANSL